MKRKSIFLLSCLCGTILHLATNAAAQLAPGLNESRYNAQYVQTQNYPAPNPVRVVRAPYAANMWGDGTDRGNWTPKFEAPPNDPGDQWPPPAGLYGDRLLFNNGNGTTFFYSGYIFIGEGSNTVSFISRFDGGKRLLIDGVQIFRENAWDSHALKTVPLATGWHTFELWTDDNNQSGFGNAWWPSPTGSRIGFGVDWEGRGSTNLDDYEFPVDDDLGSLFSATKPNGVVVFPTPTVSAVNAASASVSISIVLNPADEGTLYLCLDDVSDKGATTNNWQSLIEYDGAIVTDGQPNTYVIGLSNLALGAEYHYRFAFAFDGGGVCVSDESQPFATRVNIESRAPIQMDVTSFLLPANFSVAPDVAGTFCVFYNEGATFDPLAATRTDYLPTIAAAGVCEIAVSGLAPSTVYSYRHAYDVPGYGLWFAGGERTFETVPYDAPSRFQWAADWWGNWRPWPHEAYLEEAVIWRNLDNRPRPFPGVAGDVIQLAYPVRANILLTNDIAFAAFESTQTARENNWGRINFLPRTPVGTSVTLTLDPGDRADAAWLGGRAVPNSLIFGEINDTGRRNDLRVHLAAPLRVYGTDWGRHMFAFYCPVSGGTEQSPVPITVEYYNPNWIVLQFCLANANNTFYGDITVNGSEASLFIGNCGWAENDQIGGWPYYEYNAHDGMLGDPANKIILRNNAGIYTANDLGTFVFNRTLLGNGTLRSSKLNYSHGATSIAINENIRSTLRLGVGANLSPGEGDAVGKLTLWGSDFSCETGATFTVKVKPAGVRDTFVFDFDGTLNFNGASVLVDASAFGDTRIPAGTSWTFLTTAAPADFTGAFKSPGYSTTYTTDANGKLLSVTLVKLNPLTLFMVR